MSDAKAQVKARAFAELDSAIQGAAVYQDVPQDAPLPVVIVGDMKSFPIGAKSSQDRRVSLIIVSMVAAEERAPLLALQKQIETALAGEDGKTFVGNGWELTFTFDDDDAVLGDDGATYLGTSAFTVFAFKS